MRRMDAPRSASSTFSLDFILQHSSGGVILQLFNTFVIFNINVIIIIDNNID